MAPFRSSRAATRSGRTTGAIDDNVFLDGLPVRQWRQRAALVGAPEGASATYGAHKAMDGVADSLPEGWKESPMPKGSESYTPYNQMLLRAARMPKHIRTDTAPKWGWTEGRSESADQTNGPSGEEKRVKESATNGAGTPGRGTKRKASAEGFTAQRWTVVPKELEEPDREYLAKRREGLPSLNGFYYSQIPGVSFNGVSLGSTDVQASSNGVVVDPPRRKGPPPRKKHKKGPGRGHKKIPIPIEETSAHALAGVNGVPNNVPATVKDVKMEQTDDHDEDGDGAEGAEGSEDEDGEEGEEGEEEEGEITQDVDMQDPANPQDLKLEETPATQLEIKPSESPRPLDSAVELSHQNALASPVTPAMQPAEELPPAEPAASEVKRMSVTPDSVPIEQQPPESGSVQDRVPVDVKLQPGTPREDEEVQVDATISKLEAPNQPKVDMLLVDEPSTNGEERPVAIIDDPHAADSAVDVVKADLPPLESLPSKVDETAPPHASAKEPTELEPVEPRARSRTRSMEMPVVPEKLVAPSESDAAVREQTVTDPQADPAEPSVDVDPPVVVEGSSAPHDTRKDSEDQAIPIQSLMATPPPEVLSPPSEAAANDDKPSVEITPVEVPNGNLGSDAGDRTVPQLVQQPSEVESPNAPTSTKDAPSSENVTVQEIQPI